MHEVETYPPAKESIRRLIRSGWIMYQVMHIGPSAEPVWLVYGSNGENKVRVETTSQSEGWHRAVEAAAACGMLSDWPRPSRGVG